jgi:hypothetical protein
MEEAEGRSDEQIGGASPGSAWPPPGVAPAYPPIGSSPTEDWRAPDRAALIAPRRRRWAPVAVGTVVALLIAATVAVLARQEAGEAASPEHPSAWDPRLTELVDFVEKDRDLEFQQPVHVDFLTPQEYMASSAAEAQKVTEKDRREMGQAVALLRAFGLLEGDVDLLARLTQLSEEGTLAYYDPVTERVTVRGTELTMAVKGTLVHELTHALQDQHFNIKSLSDEDQTMKEAEAAGFLRNLVEGDAVRVENHWVESLDEDDQETYSEESEASSENADLEGIPEVIIASFGTAYSFGNALVEVIGATGGNPSVDAAFRSPPTSDEQIFDAFRYLAKDKPQTVAPPALKAGEQAINGSEPQTFGAFMLFVTLAQRLEPVAAMHAVDGWGGDQMVIFEGGGRQCARVHLAADTVADRDEMQSGLQKWVDGMPAGVASLGRAGELLELSSCDPGANHKPAGGSMQEALGVPLTRVTMAVAVMDMWDVNADQARCYTGKVLEEFTVEQLDAEEPTQAVAQKLGELAASCIS